VISTISYFEPVLPALLSAFPPAKTNAGTARAITSSDKTTIELRLMRIPTSLFLDAEAYCLEGESPADRESRFPTLGPPYHCLLIAVNQKMKELIIILKISDRYLIIIIIFIDSGIIIC
jgi:hypothetical protein